jgi:hypothetical protein
VCLGVGVCLRVGVSLCVGDLCVGVCLFSLSQCECVCVCVCVCECECECVASCNFQSFDCLFLVEFSF